MHFFLSSLLVFALVVVGDFVWGVYIKAVSENKAVKAGLNSILIYMISAVVIINYTEDHRYIVSAALGAFVGTYFSVIYNKRKQK